MLSIIVKYVCKYDNTLKKECQSLDYNEFRKTMTNRQFKKANSGKRHLENARYASKQDAG